jgi:hypothetical protein
MHGACMPETQIACTGSCPHTFPHTSGPSLPPVAAVTAVAAVDYVAAVVAVAAVAAAAAEGAVDALTAVAARDRKWSKSHELAGLSSPSS